MAIGSQAGGRGTQAMMVMAYLFYVKHIYYSQ